ncbi:LOW QUALITY PROTEIN: 1-phosphatidylinositol 4,5-bisphosphate phosphodiesterase delta-3-like [Leucoraja erinacea]|uniref:LOW QUALITY PROTEIN: 1-phosphatidylinositol 4,5-bisphosphate phosphodiesterase delta-3-like n=1 Tax=Leucoraja erinaceus TaxID=7782 RepID=UPI00245409A7|nr:LOW QUALITY PROTEIN: 1-phosphatidylinositol 4,5-bisphosphate phosphodiesterase delta-3-like [Leucoraja erinacea]
MMGTKSQGSQPRHQEAEHKKLALKAFKKVGLLEDEDVKFMLKGSKLQKLKSRRWKKDRRMKLQDDCLSIWCESKSRSKPPTFSVMDIREIQVGHQSTVMKKHGNSFSEKRCFTIVFAGSRSSLDLVAASEEEGRCWVRGLQKLRKKAETMSQREKIHHWIHEHLRNADENNDNKMSFREIKSLLKMINIETDDEYAYQVFKQCDRSKTNKLEESEIEDFCKFLMQRPELEQIFSYYSGEDQILTVRELKKFLKEQKEIATDENAVLIIQKFELNDTAKKNLLFTQDGFMMYLLSAEGDIFNRDHDQVYQDMSQPLSHYFISSSHNTYLMEDQLGGPSSTEAYIRALLRGCRCVELDCWEGQNGEPIIYHGYTLTSKILFKDVITTIRDYAFTVSPYPVILSLENHCGKEQQTVMARHLKDILGNMLVTALIDDEVPKELPSPEALKAKVLIKGKKFEDSGTTAEREEEEDDCEDENVKNGEKNKKEAVGELSEELMDLVVYCKAVHFNGFQHAWSKDCVCELSSFSENKAKKLITESGSLFVRYNTKQLSRIYPTGSRVDSSNYNPQEMWNAGCQLVALNFQKSGMEMDLNKGKFRQNGRSGYILKPSFMRNKSNLFDPARPRNGAGLNKTQLIIDVITAQQLPKVNKDKKNSIVDPLVRVEVHGVPEDNATKRTRYIENNGFNPVWNEVLKFTISVPEQALIRIVVEDYDSSSSNDFIGQFTLPFTSVKEGYRHIHLLARDSAPLSPATLFVRVRIKSV